MRLGSFVLVALSISIRKATKAAYTHLFAPCGSAQPEPPPNIPPKFFLSSQIHAMLVKLGWRGRRIGVSCQYSDVGWLKGRMGEVATLRAQDRQETSADHFHAPWSRPGVNA